MGQHKLLWACLIAFSVSFVSTQLFAQADVIEKRQKLMKGQGAAAKAIKGAAEAKDYATMEIKAKDLMGELRKDPGSLPEGEHKRKNQGQSGDLGEDGRFQEERHEA